MTASAHAVAGLVAATDGFFEAIGALLDGELLEL